MGRPKTFKRWEVPFNVVSIVEAICCDYGRRETALKYYTMSCELQDQYSKLNTAIDNALKEVDAGLRQYLFDDVRKKRGWIVSPARELINKNSYYAIKRKFIHDIAYEINLIAY